MLGQGAFRGLIVIVIILLVVWFLYQYAPRWWS